MLSKIAKVQRVYRGISEGMIPNDFWEKNEQGVRGGIEVARAPSANPRSLIFGTLPDTSRFALVPGRLHEHDGRV